jgi:hypothetical protein
MVRRPSRWSTNTKTQIEPSSFVQPMVAPVPQRADVGASMITVPSWGLGRRRLAQRWGARNLTSQDRDLMVQDDNLDRQIVLSAAKEADEMGHADERQVEE